MQRVEKLIEIDAPIERVFDLFSDFEDFPRWMRHIRDVHYSGENYTRWKAEAPLGTSVEWEAETTDFDPPRRIAWRSVRGDIDTQGDVTFRETRRGTTMMRVRLKYQPPAGRLGAMVASLLGTDPQQELEEDLERFAQVAERRRSARGRDRASDKPRRNRLRSREFYDERGRDFYQNARGHSGADESVSSEDERRLDFDADWDERLGRPLPRRTEREDHSRVGRYAMTPRERERERRERRADFEYKRAAFRRGVDRLLDVDPPSRHWRRS